MLMRRIRRRGWRHLLLGLTPLLVVASALGTTGRAATASGATVRFALPPATTPNYILPLTPGPYSSNANIDQFQYLMWRPLYWFGENGRPVVNYGLSLASAPIFSNHDRTVTINLRRYRWSDGTPVSSRDVAFWMNLLIANKANWFAYAPGAFPDNVRSLRYPSSTQVVMTLTRSFNPEWFLYNELSQITPLPQQSWDRVRSGGPVGNYDTTRAGAVAVFNFLNGQAKTLATYDTNPLWQVVDGPWRLEPKTGFVPTTGYTTFVPNPSYSGPVRPTIARFVEVPFTTDQSEFLALRAGEVQYGYLPTQDLPQRGYLRSRGYRLQPWNAWGFGQIRMNWPSTTVGPLLQQLYIRQAMQRLIDQTAWITRILKGFAVPTYGPVPTTPPNPFASTFEKDDPYPYSVSAARTLLRTHGWRVNPSGVSTCQRPGAAAGDCGARIRRGEALQFTIAYPSGDLSGNQEMEAMQSSFSLVGMRLLLHQEPFDDTVSIAPCDRKTGEGCNWELDWDGAGWTYSPDYLPTGEELYQTGAGANKGGYSNRRNDANIAATEYSNSTRALFTYENYLAAQLPALWVPWTPIQLSEISTRLSGVSPQDPIDNIYPENWRLGA